MKASTNPTHPCGRALRTLTSYLGILFVAATLASCGTSSSGSLASSPVSFQPEHWFKAQSQPPTYFPKGVHADHPTTFNDGMWVITGDSVGTRYFIPFRGVDTEMLTAEAMHMMTPEKREAVRKGPRARGSAAGALGAGLTGLAYALLEVDRQTGGQLLYEQPRR